MAKRVSKSGAELFVLDNGRPEASARWYLHEWCQYARQIDIASGYFEIGALLALQEAWQQVESIRILMGDDLSKRTRTELLRGLKTTLDASLEAEKDQNAFLEGVPAIVDAIAQRQIDCRIYRREKFHAKTYITHPKSPAMVEAALVGSSNFTVPGLTQNVELNVRVVDPQVSVLMEWFEEHWAQAEEVREEVQQILERHTKEYAPFLIYAKALQEFFRSQEMSAAEWERERSRMYRHLSKYQQDGYGALMKIAEQFGGAFLCDGVGLGKTFIGLMLIERLIWKEGKRVVLFAPKAAVDGVWKPHIERYLPHIGGVSGSEDFSQLSVFSHTDFSRRDPAYKARLDRVSRLADVVLIDEAHQFRNQGQRANEETGRDDSRYYKLFKFLAAGESPKQLFMLTATPINNSLNDFRNLIQLFTREEDAYFGSTLGIHNLRAHFADLTKRLKKQLEAQKLQIDPDQLGDNIALAADLLGESKTFQALVVQRSRAYVQESQKLEGTDRPAIFPERKEPQVAKYSIRATYGDLLQEFSQACSGEEPLFTLPLYKPLDYFVGDKAKLVETLSVPSPPDSLSKAEKIEWAFEFARGRQRQVVIMIRTGSLKRFESSVQAFEISCNRLMRKLLAFLEVHCELETELATLRHWKQTHSRVLGMAQNRAGFFWDEEAEAEYEEDVVTEDLRSKIEKLPRADYNLAEMFTHTYADLDTLVHFLTRLQQFKPANDDKLKRLEEILKFQRVKDEKMLIFTEFADTADYLGDQLSRRGFPGIFVLHSGKGDNRAEVIQRFAPYYNGTSSADLKRKMLEEIQILISTDVLSEGLNLQDATRMMNYDIHWNPVRLMQRIGRVDRRLNLEIEARLIADHPALEGSRRKVEYWNFLPPEELNEVLSLYRRVTSKTLLISKTLGIEGKKLLTPEDDYAALREFNHQYEGEQTSTEKLKLEWQALIRDHVGLEAVLDLLPGSVFSGKKRVKKQSRGVFFCFALPGYDRVLKDYTFEAGRTHWLLYDLDSDAIIEEPTRIAEAIRCTDQTPRHCTEARPKLLELRRKAEQLLRNSYLRSLNAPLTVKPHLRCWMEIS